MFEFHVNRPNDGVIGCGSGICRADAPKNWDISDWRFAGNRCVSVRYSPLPLMGYLAEMWCWYVDTKPSTEELLSLFWKHFPNERIREVIENIIENVHRNGIERRKRVDYRVRSEMVSQQTFNLYIVGSNPAGPMKKRIKLSD